MSAITPILTSIAADLVVQILVIVAALASLVGISILVAYGFRHLRSVGGVSYDGGYSADDEEDNWDIPGFTDDSDRDSGDPTPQG